MIDKTISHYKIIEKLCEVSLDFCYNWGNVIIPSEKVIATKAQRHKVFRIMKLLINGGF